MNVAEVRPLTWIAGFAATTAAAAIGMHEIETHGLREHPGLDSAVYTTLGISAVCTTFVAPVLGFSPTSGARLLVSGGLIGALLGSMVGKNAVQS